jgi:HEPN domain-containing protein
MLDADLFDETTWEFQIQQATEKALKAWFAVLGHEYPYTHDLALLYRLIGDFGGDSSAIAASPSSGVTQELL